MAEPLRRSQSPPLPLLQPARQIVISGANCYHIIVSHFKCLTQLRHACHFLPKPFAQHGSPCLPLFHLSLSRSTISLSEERSPLLLPFIILIATPPFTSQTSPPLALPQKGKVRGDNEGGNRSSKPTPPPTTQPRLCCFHGCTGKTKPSGEERERERECAREKLYCFQSNL